AIVSSPSRSAARMEHALYPCEVIRLHMTDSLNLSLRHEVARLIVWHVVTRPVVPSTVSYEDVREGNDPYRALGHGTHSHLTGTKTVSQRCICQHRAEK